MEKGAALLVLLIMRAHKGESQATSEGGTTAFTLVVPG
jgi:hypothetical protein